MRKSFSAGLVLLATLVAGAWAVMAANAQPAPQGQFTFLDQEMDPLQKLKALDGGKPFATGDDKIACERAHEARARFEAGRSTAREHSRALEHAKSAAATTSMRQAIASGLLPACPPDVDPLEVGP